MGWQKRGAQGLALLGVVLDVRDVAGLIRNAFLATSGSGIVVGILRSVFQDIPWEGLTIIGVSLGLGLLTLLPAGLRLTPWSSIRREDTESIEFPQLSLILKHDLASPASMVKITERRVVKWDLPARRSEVVFGVTIFNGSVYDISVGPATGNLTYKGQQLETPIVPRQGGINRLLRGHEYEIKLTQYVPDDLTFEIKRELDSGCVRMFGWMGVTVSLRADYPDAPDAPMVIGDGKGFRVGD